MMVLALALGCSRPDPDALLHAGELKAASEAWARTHGAPLDIEHPVAEILAHRAVSDPSITAASVADAMEAVRLLEQAPAQGTNTLDLNFDSFVDFAAALDVLMEPPSLVVVGRSEGLGDKDPFTLGGPLPWKGGRVVGWARSEVVALGKKLEEDPPARLVVVAMRDATGEVFINVEHRDGAWWTMAASRPKIAARLVLAAGTIRDYGGGDPTTGAASAASADALRAREGRGLYRR